MKTQENNIKIAEFMGYIETGDGEFLISLSTNYDHSIDEERFRYDTDWNYLMSVIQEIEKKTGWILVMASGYAYFTDGNGQEHELGDMYGWQSINNIYDCVVEFIDWHNNGKT